MITPPSDQFRRLIVLDQVLSRRRVHPSRNRKTKIVCAIGPSCASVERLGQLLDAGMNVARFNFSHRTHGYHAENLANLREAISTRRSCHCAILMDTKGPEIRTGELEHHKPIQLRAGQTLEIVTTEETLGNAKRISCSYRGLASAVMPGSTILVADGEITLKVLTCDIPEDLVVVHVMNHCVLEERKNMNLPGAKVDIPGITEKDRDDLVNFGLVQGIDIVSGSFVRSAANVRAIRDCLGPRGRHIRIHAKIESLEALLNFDSILQAADGVHVSRGDLGMELRPEQVFLAQKHIIRRANLAGKPVVTSTQMLQSMTLSHLPTFAECSDVANAVLDGSDCVMLSAETAKGRFPVRAVEMMHRICLEAEASLNSRERYENIRTFVPHPVSLVEALASTAVETSLDLEAKVICCFSETGQTAKLVAKYRPAAQILVLTPSAAVARQMEGLSRGVTSMLVSSTIGTEVLLDRAIGFAKSVGWISDGDFVVTLHGRNEGRSGHTNIVRVIKCSTMLR